MEITKINSVNNAILGIYRLLVISFVLFTLYFAQTIVIPLTLAGLLTFLLSPLVSRVEKWLGRIVSILLVVLVVFSLIGLGSYVFTRQLILFGTNFEQYNENIQVKLKSLKFPSGGVFDRLGQTLGNLRDELFGESGAAGVQGSEVSPFNIRLIDISSTLTNFAETLFGSFFSFIGSTGLILLLVIFMLLNKEDIRSRVIKLMGQHRISSTTIAIDDASDRVSGYLFRLFIVNICFGICVSLGLFLIGIPNVILWGAFGAIMRFIPYIGSWIAALIPIALSFIITDTWLVPVLTISFFIILELFTAYFVEPFYYGSGTGVSSFALILAAVFWTWLWGPIGLLLSTPLTVCLVVMGHHMTNLSFLRIMLSHEQALTPAEECYYRLLSFDTNETMEVVETYLKANSLASLYDTIIIPIIVKTEADFHIELIDVEKRDGIYQNIHEILEYVTLNEAKEAVSKTKESKQNILCVPARTQRDELGAHVLFQLLAAEPVEVFGPAKFDFNEIFELIDKKLPNIVCIVVVAPFILSHTRYLCAKIHQRYPQLPIVICLWGFTKISSEITEKLNSAGATKIVSSPSETVKTLQEMQK